MTIEEMIQKGVAIKDIIKDTTFKGKNWKVITIESLSKTIAVIDRDYILSVMRASTRNIDGFTAAVDIIANHLGETKLEGLALSAAAALTESSKKILVILAMKQVATTAGADQVYIPTFVIDYEKATFTFIDPSAADDSKKESK